MKPLRIFDIDLNLLGEIDDYESLLMTRKLHTYNELSMQINQNKQNTEYLEKGNLLSVGRLGTTTDRPRAFIIRQVKKTLGQGGKGSENIEITAYGLTEVFTRRITLPPSGSAKDSITDEGETVIKHYVENNVTNPDDADREIPQVNILTDDSRGEEVEWESRYKKLNEELTKIAKLAGLGLEMEVNYETLDWDFDVIEGKDLTTSQSENNPVIFSYEFDNIKTQEYTHSDIEERNYAYVGGDGEGTDREIEEVGDETGIDRKELFVDAANDDISLTKNGEQELSGRNVIETLEGQILENGPFEYIVDWDLGDVVTVKNSKWGIETEATITEVMEVFEPGEMKIEVTFGDKPEDIIKKMKDEIDRVSGGVNK